MLVIKYGYMFRFFLSHPQANMVTEFRYIKRAPNPIRCAFYIPKFWDLRWLQIKSVELSEVQVQVYQYENWGHGDEDLY